MVEMVLTLLLGWKQVFAQQRTTRRAICQALSSACVLGRRTIARSILVREPEAGQPGDWSADYRLHARSPWAAQRLFDPMLRAALARCPGDLLPLATDDTRLPKTGKKVHGAGYWRDPMGPAFHVNLQWGLRFLHTAVLVPLHQTDSVSARAIPVWFQDVPPIKKPGKKASEDERVAYTKAVKAKNLSTEAVAMFKAVRERVDAAGGAEKTLCFALDGSFTNKTTLRAELERTILIGRVRKDAKLCLRSREPRRIYDPRTFTPAEVMRDEAIAWQTAEIFHGGKMRVIGYKHVNQVLWRGGAGRRALRLLVVRPTPYRLTKTGRTLWRDPAFLLCTTTEGDPTPMLQVYFDRLHIEIVQSQMTKTRLLAA